MLTTDQLTTISAVLSQAIKDSSNLQLKENRDEVRDALSPVLSTVDYESGLSEEDRASDAERVLRARYYSYVRDMAKEIYQEIADGNLTTRDELERWISETVDGSEWVFKTGLAIQVLLWSSNDSAYGEEFGDEGMVNQCGAVNFSGMAYSAIMADLHEDLELFKRTDKPIDDWFDDSDDDLVSCASCDHIDPAEDFEDGCPECEHKEHNPIEGSGAQVKARNTLAEFKRCGYKV